MSSDIINEAMDPTGMITEVSKGSISSSSSSATILNDEDYLEKHNHNDQDHDHDHDHDDSENNEDTGYVSSSASSFTGSSSNGPNYLQRSDSTNSVAYIDLGKLLFVNDFDFGLNLDTVSDKTKQKFNDMKLKTKEKFNMSQRSVEFIKLQEIFQKRLAKFDERVHKNLESSSTEKLFYAIALFLIVSAGFIIGKYPTYFPLFHTVIFSILIPIRCYTFFKISYEYFLADLCYYVNLLLMTFIWIFPNSPTLFISVFSLSLGTLSFAVITWRNSLVLHSIEKTTSSFVHVMPPVTMFVLVHELPKDHIKERFPGIAAVDNWDFFYGIFWTSVYYTIWQVSYHFFITIRKREKIAQGKATSLTFLKRRQKHTVLGKFVNSLPTVWLQTLVFTFIQFFYQILAMMLCPIWFKYKHACGAFVLFIFVWASYNGATYYIDVFGKRFENEVDRLRNEIKNLQQENEKLQFSPLNKPQSFNDDLIKPLENLPESAIEE
ncbi:hypothetical protein DFJ63DRAFT_101694 [Scheffersomyces coipomensis]|uniref:uncharacterized protein n=1 Tax=Scheffersomyces coipomensis TaxID=1788519 RepID=UPI00315D10C6